MSRLTPDEKREELLFYTEDDPEGLLLSIKRVLNRTQEPPVETGPPGTYIGGTPRAEREKSRLAAISLEEWVRTADADLVDMIQHEYFIG